MTPPSKKKTAVRGSDELVPLSEDEKTALMGELEHLAARAERIDARLEELQLELDNLGRQRAAISLHRRALRLVADDAKE